MNKNIEIKKFLFCEVCGWKIATIGFLALSLSTNAALYGLLYRETAKHRKETDDLRNELYMEEQIRDHAVQELGALSIEVELERMARSEQLAAYEEVCAWTYAGEFIITAYCPCAECCGKWADGLTATGIPAVPGIVAVDPDVIPIGSTVVIDGIRFLAADTGVTGNRVDIFMTDHDDTVQYGVKTEKVWCIK